MNFEMKLINLIEADNFLLSVLRTVETLQIKDCWVAAGIIRNKVWDYLHNIETIINDIDIIYFDEADTSIETEKILETRLNKLMPNQPWSVKNQARMHLKNNMKPYLSSYDGVAHFPEIPTSIAVRLIDHKIEVMAPYGVEDLFAGRVRPTPPYIKGSNRHSIYLERMQVKKWNTIWRNLIIEEI